jgi:methanogenic corrinoid protein MtbC1
MLDALIHRYNQAVFDVDKDAALEVVEIAIGEGVSPEDVLFRIVIPATEILMSKITQDADANLAQHFLTALIASEVTDQMLRMFDRPPETIGRVVIGTSYGDLHSLGKKILVGCLKAQMVQAIDLGVNVRAESFVNAALEQNASVIAISSMMVHTAMGDEASIGVRRILQARGLESRISIIVGGAPFRFDEDLYRAAQADAWAVDAVSGSKRIVQLLQASSAP